MLNINDLITTKVPLRFDENGRFRILMISDIHGGRGFAAEATETAIDALIDEAKPDLLLIAGDICGPGMIHVDTEEDLKNVLDVLSAPMRKRGIPWAHVFGNHDDRLPGDVQEKIYESYPLCVSKGSLCGAYGDSNYVLPVYDAKGEKILFNVFGIDDSHKVGQFKETYGISTPIYYPSGRHNGEGSVITFDQIMWYWQASEALEQYNGAKIPAIMFMHIPLPEFGIIIEHPSDCKMNGAMREDVSCSTMNSGMFAACLERGDVKGIFCGHDHTNDYTGTYCGITLGYDGFLSYHACQDNDVRGGRIIDVDASDPASPAVIRTSLIKLKDVMGKAGDSFL